MRAVKGEAPVEWCYALVVWQITVFADNLFLVSYAHVSFRQGVGSS